MTQTISKSANNYLIIIIIINIIKQDYITLNKFEYIQTKQEIM